MSDKKSASWISKTAHLYYYLAFIYYLREIVLWVGIAGLVGNLTLIFYQKYVVAALGLALSVIAIIGGIILYVVGIKRRYRAANPALKLLSAATTLKVLPENRYRHFRVITFKARHDGVQHFNHRFSWSGTGNIDLRVGDPAMSGAITDHDKSVRKQLRITFDRPLKKGEEKTIEYTFEMTDTAGTARPFLSSTITEDVGRVSLRVMIETAQSKTFQRSIYMGSSSDIPMFEDKVASSPAECAIEWSISRPRIGFVYCINW